MRSWPPCFLCYLFRLSASAGSTAAGRAAVRPAGLAGTNAELHEAGEGRRPEGQPRGSGHESPAAFTGALLPLLCASLLNGCAWKIISMSAFALNWWIHSSATWHSAEKRLKFLYFFILESMNHILHCDSKPLKQHLSKWQKRVASIKSDFLLEMQRALWLCLRCFVHIWCCFSGIQSSCGQWAAPPRPPVSAWASDGRRPGAPLWTYSVCREARRLQAAVAALPEGAGEPGLYLRN